MTNKFRALAQGMVVLSLSATATGRAVAQPADGASETNASAVSGEQLEKARAVFKLGVGVLQNDPIDYATAFTHFQRAHRLSRSWKVLGNLGLCAYHLEKYDEALRYYAEYLDKGKEQVSEQEIASVRAETETMLSTSGTVQLSGGLQPMTVEATRLGSGMPPLTVEVASGAVLKLRLKEGRHRLVARAADGEKSELELAVVAGQSTDGRFFFAQPVVNSARLPAAAVPIDVPEAGWSTTQQVGFGTIGLGAAGLAVAMGYGFLAEGRKRSAEAQCQGMDEGQGSGCDGTALEDFKAHTRYIKAVNTLLIAGGVTAATGMGLIVFGGNDATTVQAKLTLTPYWTGASAGLAASGAF